MPAPKSSSQKKVFISYRVQDTSADTGRLVDSLKQVFYEDQVFMDIEKLEPGVDFRVALAKSLETCDVLFAVIGPGWIGTDKNGNPRIKHAEDWVRIELETALKRDIRIIPVLVREASLPQPEELPESLYPLLNRQTYEISNKRWKYDTDQLIKFLIQIGFQPRERDIPLPQKPGGAGKWLMYGLVGLGILVLVALFLETFKDKSPTEKKNDDNHYAVDSPKAPVNNNHKQVKEENIDIAPVNVAGGWFDATSQYIMYINQTGSTLELRSVAATGVTTGEGVGTVEGDKMNFKVQLYNVGVISGSASVRENSRTLNGKFIITANGASYTEDFYWTRQ
ncbi:MAG: toll/interleukin-1 receptor domain-containing protein [Agriterribacter sp.]